MSQKIEINCIYAKDEKCHHPLVEKRLFFFAPYCLRGSKIKGFHRCTLQTKKETK